MAPADAPIIVRLVVHLHHSCQRAARATWGRGGAGARGGGERAAATAPLLQRQRHKPPTTALAVLARRPLPPSGCADPWLAGRSLQQSQRPPLRGTTFLISASKMADTRTQIFSAEGQRKA